MQKIFSEGLKMLKRLINLKSGSCCTKNVGDCYDCYELEMFHSLTIQINHCHQTSFSLKLMSCSGNQEWKYLKEVRKFSHAIKNNKASVKSLLLFLCNKNIFKNFAFYPQEPKKRNKQVQQLSKPLRPWSASPTNPASHCAIVELILLLRESGKLPPTFTCTSTPSPLKVYRRPCLQQFPDFTECFNVTKVLHSSE